MGFEAVPVSQEKATFSRIFSGTLMIAGTTIGAGMLGIPLVTSQAGFVPAAAITALVWIFMLCTGLLFLEAALWMPEGANVLSMAGRFFGRKGKFFAGGMFVFLYYCLMIAYFAGGAPLLSTFLHHTIGLELSGWQGTLVFGLIFGLIVGFGAKCIDRVNMVLTIAMVGAYVALMGAGSSAVNFNLLVPMQWPALFFAIPVLFSAFGYHNIIPSLCTYLKRDRKALKISIFSGTAIAFAVYLLWQWLIIGAIPQEAIAQALKMGQPVTQALQAAAGSSMIFLIGQYFAFFALVTSMLGVAFSLVDFLRDGLKQFPFSGKRSALTILAFLPPFICAAANPAIFDRALGIAGGFGEAMLNGLLPVALVWAGRKVYNDGEGRLPGGKWSLATLFGAALFVIGLETVYLLGM